MSDYKKRFYPLPYGVTVWTMSWQRKQNRLDGTIRIPEGWRPKNWRYQDRGRTYWTSFNGPFPIERA